MWRTDIHWKVVKHACFTRNDMQPVEGVRVFMRSKEHVVQPELTTVHRIRK